MDTWMIVLLSIIGLIILIILIIVGWYISTLNRFRIELEVISQAESNIDVSLTKRYDLLTKLLASTKAYMKHEKTTLEDIVALRQPSGNASIKDKAQFESQMQSSFDKINVVVEQYPQLKADSVIIDLQRSTANIENDLQAARRSYNAKVTNYNQSIIVFPNNIVAKRRDFVKKDFFEADVSKREDIKFDF